MACMTVLMDMMKAYIVEVSEFDDGLKHPTFRGLGVIVVEFVYYV